MLLNKSLRYVKYVSTLLYGGAQTGSISGIMKTGGSYHILQNNNAAPFICERVPDFKTFMYTRGSSLSTFAMSDPIGASLDNGKAGPMAEYERRIASGELLAGDTFQLDTIKMLQRLYEDLLENEDSCQLDKCKDADKHTRGMWLWSSLLSNRSYSKVKGLYLFGGVGTGKTMLMDLFYDKLPSNWRKKRIHFHDFMLNVHSRLQMHKGVTDPLGVVAKEISDESILLCLDEFMVTDVADALILNRLFRHLFNKGVVLVCTSNRAPDQLYEGGLQRNLFLPFIDTVKERCLVHPIGSSTDYRKIGSAEQGFYFIGHKYNGYLKEKFLQLIRKDTPQPQIVEVVMGRKLKVPLGSDGCAFFPFEELCDRPLGAADYFGLFRNFHTLVLEGVPKFAAYNRTAAHRFITLVDVMYENRARLVCTAEASPLELFEQIVTISDAEKFANAKSSSLNERKDGLDLCVDNEMGFAKDRTISRFVLEFLVGNLGLAWGFIAKGTDYGLTEMNSREYLEQHNVNLRKAS